MRLRTLHGHFENSQSDKCVRNVNVPVAVVVVVQRTKLTTLGSSKMRMCVCWYQTCKMCRETLQRLSAGVMGRVMVGLRVGTGLELGSSKGFVLRLGTASGPASKSAFYTFNIRTSALYPWPTLPDADTYPCGLLVS